MSEFRLDFTSWSRWRRYKSKFPLFIELLKPSKDDVILDVGAGTGVIAYAVANLCDEVYALEPEVKRVDYVRKKFPEVKVFQSFAESIPFPENYFTKIYVISAFHHFKNPELALSEFERVSKSKSLLLIQEKNPQGTLANLSGNISKHNFIAAKTLREKVELAGFQLLRVENAGAGYFVLFRRL